MIETLEAHLHAWLRRSWARRCLWGIWAALLAAVIYGSIASAFAPPGGLGLDKLAHFLAYACLAVVPALLTGGLRAVVPWAVFVCLLGAGLEAAQSWMAAREASLADLVFNVAGVVAGTSIGLAMARRGTVIGKVTA
mgnify:CR=1 FL=1